MNLLKSAICNNFQVLMMALHRAPRIRPNTKGPGAPSASRQTDRSGARYWAKRPASPRPTARKKAAPGSGFWVLAPGKRRRPVRSGRITNHDLGL